MFDFLRSEDSKLRRSAAQWLEMAQRIHDFRKDLLTAEQGGALLAAMAEVKALVKQKAGVASLKPAIERLEGSMRACGGRLYPTTSLAENVEFFLVAAIVILGLRAYFVQPFKIPTNSMWPSYYGMTSEVFTPGEEPGVLGKAARLVGLGAINYTLKAPAEGEVLVPVFRSGMPAYTERPGRSLFIFPTLMREYTVMVGGQLVKLTVPADWARSEFGYDDVLEKTLFSGRKNGLMQAAQSANGSNQLESSMMEITSGGRRIDARVYWVPTGRKVGRGDEILSFDILTGDLLFVDRMSYNFVRPVVGSGFVFKTDNINHESMKDAAGRQISQYYVKRLVGIPGDQLEIREPVLYRNGRPIEGSDAFKHNAERDGLYRGYFNGSSHLRVGEVLDVSKGSYFAMGDNSSNSADSRVWGFVPEMDVVGRPLFIYYPLTKRWGVAK
ncbi:MAG: signal peptidase [Verrucomicrobiota bacterium]|nr:signal peptidase [Verrucomicrobiota bacterium]